MGCAWMHFSGLLRQGTKKSIYFWAGCGASNVVRGLGNKIGAPLPTYATLEARGAPLLVSKDSSYSELNEC